MAAILRRQPLTIKQQVEELKNWHKQQQSRLDPKVSEKEHFSSKNSENKGGDHVKHSQCDFNSTSRTNFDDIPIKVTNSNFNALVENNVAAVDSDPVSQTGRPEEKGKQPKFRFLRKGEGIARFNMGPPKVSKKTLPRKQSRGLKLIKEPRKYDNPLRDHDVNHLKCVNSENEREIPTLKVPDIKLNFTWKSILSGGNPEDVLEKAITSNQLDLMDPNSSIDSSTASLMEKLLAVGRNKLSKDREELRVFEAIEQHMLDSSFCSTSSYVAKLMENAVISTPNKNTLHHQQPQTSKYSGSVQDGIEVSSQQEVVSKTMSNPSSNTSVEKNTEKEAKISTTETKVTSNQSKSNSELITSNPVGVWTKPETIRSQDNDSIYEESIANEEQSLHVRFSEQVDYKSFIDQTQSTESISQVEENASIEFDESQEWKEDSEDSSSCCSQCTKHDESTEHERIFNPQEKPLQPNQNHSQIERNSFSERLNVSDLKLNDKFENNGSSSQDLNNFPPLLIAKLRELEEEIQIFRKENFNIKTLRESLERERKQIQEDRRQLNLEKKKLQKEMEEEQKRLAAHYEEEKQKLFKEKVTFEKYSKSLTKNTSREERKEIQALKEQLTEMKEELNKKESRWGAAQARVRNQVKVLEEDNKKLREEIDKFRKQTKYWELLNQKKKGKPFNNTRLIHAISEHISNIVLEDDINQDSSAGNTSYLNQNSSPPKLSCVTQSDLKSMYGVKVLKENKKNSTIPTSKNIPISISNKEGFSPRNSGSKLGAENINIENKSPCISDSSIFTENCSGNPNADIDKSKDKIIQNEGRCQKPCLEEASSNVIKEVVDENGNAEIVFPNGNIKKINKITGSEKYIYINGDVEEITHDGTVKYYYSKSRIWQTTLPDGLEIVDFPDGKVEKRHVDGTIEIIYSNNNKKFSYPDGSQEVIYTDGTKLKTGPDKTQVLTLPNGQKEIHTEEWKRREYPDGTKKTLYPDGTTETVYANGRVRLKDKFGNLVMDSGLPSTS